MTNGRLLRRFLTKVLPILIVSASAGGALAFTVEECDQMYNWTIENICTTLASPRARERCYRTAMENYAKCLASAEMSCTFPGQAGCF
jgi:hypothetical protein